MIQCDTWNEGFSSYRQGKWEAEKFGDLPSSRIRILSGVCSPPNWVRFLFHQSRKHLNKKRKVIPKREEWEALTHKVFRLFIYTFSEGPEWTSPSQASSCPSVLKSVIWTGEVRVSWRGDLVPSLIFSLCIFSLWWMNQVGPSELPWATRNLGYTWPRCHDVRMDTLRCTPTKAGGGCKKCRQRKRDFRPIKKRKPRTQRLMSWELVRRECQKTSRASSVKSLSCPCCLCVSDSSNTLESPPPSWPSSP